MQTIARKWGNSLAVRIPTSLVKDIKISDGSLLKISASQGKIIIEVPVKKKVKYTLNDLLKKVNKKNIHSEITTGKHIGKEIW